MSSLRGAMFTETHTFDGGRSVTIYVPPDSPDSIVYAADGGWHTERLARELEDSAQKPSTMIVGVHGPDDHGGRLNEYVESFGGERFAAFERFFVEDIGAWVQSDLSVELSSERTAVWGASLGGELALAMGLRHPATYGVILCASPGGGFTPANGDLPRSIPRTYLVGGRQEQWFLDNAVAWADALGARGADVVIEKRNGEHGGTFWYAEFPLMVSWAFSR